MVGDIIYYKDRIYLVIESKVKKRILEEDTCTNIVEPTLDDKLDGNMASTSDPLNKKALSVVVQLPGDADFIEDCFAGEIFIVC